MDDFELLRRAREAEPGVDQIEDDLGHAVRIERDPSESSAMRLDPTGFGEDAILETTWQLPATDSPTSVHPAGIPFLPGLWANVSKTDGALMAAWTADARARPDPAELERITRELPPDILEMLATAEQESDTRAAIRRLGEQLRDRMADDSLDPWPDPPPDMVPPTALNDAFELVCRELEETEWTRSDESPAGTSAFRSATFTKGETVRRVTLSGPGIAQLTIMESPTGVG